MHCTPLTFGGRQAMHPPLKRDNVGAVPTRRIVTVAQLVVQEIVSLPVAGSSPVSHLA